MILISVVTSVFVISMLLWIYYSINYADSIKGFSGFVNASPYDISGIILTIALPVILALLILIFFYILFFLFKSRAFFVKLNHVNTKINDNLEVIARRMIESVKLTYSSEFFKVFPVVMETFADALTDIITRSGIASELIISSEMEKYGNNRIVATCRIILNAKENQVDFDETLRRSLKKNESLLAAVEGFKSAYDRVLDATNRYDRDKFLYLFLEEGLLGKVYVVLTKALDSVK